MLDLYLNQLQKFLEQKADEFDKQVAENRTGGWSTNSNKLLIESANEFRRKASELRNITK